MPFRVITIDGPAGVGKSTVAGLLAVDLGWARLDSGAMYRAVALAALDDGVDLEDEAAVASLAASLALDVGLDGRVRRGAEDITERLRSPEVTAAAARLAAYPAVRGVMVAHQRRFAAAAAEGVVAEGRDMGTVVFPDAAVKVFLDGDAGERARRRLRQDAGAEAAEDAQDLARVRAQIEARDAADRSRAASPLRPAEDAWRLETTAMTLDEVFEAVRSHVRSRIPVVFPPESGA